VPSRSPRRAEVAGDAVSGGPAVGAVGVLRRGQGRRLVADELMLSGAALIGHVGAVL
jgi:hypothetical protein